MVSRHSNHSELIMGWNGDDVGSFAYIHVLLAFRLPSLDNFYLKDSNISPDEVKSEFSSLVPFLFDQKSTVRYETPRDAYSSVWERIGSESVSLVNYSHLLHNSTRLGYTVNRTDSV